MTQNYSQEFLDLYNDLFAVVEYPQELADQVAAAQPLWEEFCSLPQEIKSRFDFPDEDWNFGYIKKGSKENEDEKEYYHFAANHQELLDKHNLNDLVEQEPQAAAFFSYCEKLLGLVTEFAVTHNTALAKDNPHLDGLVEQTASGFEKSLGLIRFLHYTPAQDAEILADAHFDRGAMTFHLYESQEGLQFLNWDGSWRNSPVEEGKTVLFTGYGLESLSDGVLQRTWHRVMPDPHAQSPERYSIVLFCDFPDVPGWDRFTNGIARLQPQEYQPKKEI